MGEFVDRPLCGQHKEADKTDRHLCVDCAKAEKNRITYYRNHQGDWMAAAADAGIDVWLQQPGETDYEYTVWTAFRDSYPGRKASYVDIAKQLNAPYSSIKAIAARWTFTARMQAWVTECDRITMLQRRSEILSMNADHIDMAQRLRQKLSTAIDQIEPFELKPSEIATLAKLSTELERKARVDTIAQDELRRDLLQDNGNPELKKSPTKSGDLSEVVQILLKAGALGKLDTVGVRETTTREVVLKDGTSEASVIQEVIDD